MKQLLEMFAGDISGTGASMDAAVVEGGLELAMVLKLLLGLRKELRLCLELVLTCLELRLLCCWCRSRAWACG